MGSVVLAVHDASDVFLEVGKLTKYGGYEIIPSIAFVGFAISWILLRLIIFPFWVIRSTRYDDVYSLQKCSTDLLPGNECMFTKTLCRIFFVCS